jgi:hypothetical protein
VLESEFYKWYLKCQFDCKLFRYADISGEENMILLVGEASKIMMVWYMFVPVFSWHQIYRYLGAKRRGILGKFCKK